MQKNKIILVTILLALGLGSNSNLFSVNDSQNTNVGQTQKQPQQEETFWQKNKAPIIVVSAIAALIFTAAIVRRLKKEKKRADKNIFEGEKTQDETSKEDATETIHLTFDGDDEKNVRIINEPMPEIECEKDEAGNVILTNLKTGEKYSLEEWYGKYAETNKWKEAGVIASKAIDEMHRQETAKLKASQAAERKKREAECEREAQRSEVQVKKITEKFWTNIKKLEKEREALLNSI
jgi:hypothetical protein